MIYCIDPSVDEPIMLINKHIGFDETDGMGVDGSTFQKELLTLDTMNKKRIQVWINSPGGIVTDGYSIYSAILKTKTPVDTFCVGAAASIAGVIFQAGRKRIMADYSWLMYHNPFGGDDTDILQVMQESIITMIEQRSGMTPIEVETMMKRTTFILADEALKMKLCDQVDESRQQNIKYLRTITNPQNFYKECNLVLNSILNNQNQPTMSKVTMRLRLNDSAPEDDMLKAIDAIEDRAKKAEDAKKESEDKAKAKAKEDEEAKAELEDKFTKAKEALDKAKKDYADCKSELDALKKDKKDAEDKAEEDRAKDMVTNFAKVGRIKNEEMTILDWTNTAKTLGYDKVKSMIEALPLNKVAPVIDLAPNKLEKGQLSTTALSLAVMNKLKREGKL